MPRGGRRDFDAWGWDMIHIEPLPPGEHAWAYMFVDDNAVFKVDDYDGICTIRWEPPDVCWISAMKTEREGRRRVDRRVLRQLVEVLMARQVRYVRATRATGRILPRAKRLPDGSFEVDLWELVREPFNTDLAPLS